MGKSDGTRPDTGKARHPDMPRAGKAKAGSVDVAELRCILGIHDVIKIVGRPVAFEIVYLSVKPMNPPVRFTIVLLGYGVWTGRQLRMNYQGTKQKRGSDLTVRRVIRAKPVEITSSGVFRTVRGGMDGWATWWNNWRWKSGGAPWILGRLRLLDRGSAR